MGLTRGSRTEIGHGPVMFNSMSMKEWGKRHFSNDWIKGKKSIFTGGSSSRSEEQSRSRDFAKPGPLSSKPHPPQKSSHSQGCISLLLATTLGSSFTFLFFLDENINRKFTFPSRKSRKEPPEPLQLNSSTGEYYPGTGTITTSRSRSRAPSLRSTPSGRRTQYTVQNNTTTPTRSLLRLPPQRSNSQGGPSLNYTNSWSVSNNNIPKSAKKWGRTAHLHEVRSAVPHSVFSSTGGGGNGQRTKRGSSERLSGPRFDHDRARPSREFEYDSEDVFSVLRRPISVAAPKRANNKDDNNGTSQAAEDEVTTTAGPGLLLKTDLPVDDGDPWVDTDSVGSESGTDLPVYFGEF